MNPVPEILIVEDDEAHDALIRRAFEDYAQPARLRTVRSFRDARLAIENARPDLVITDLRLPDGDGAELVRALREGAECPVVVMTAFGDQKVPTSSISYSVPVAFSINFCRRSASAARRVTT